MVLLERALSDAVIWLPTTTGSSTSALLLCTVSLLYGGPPFFGSIVELATKYDDEQPDAMDAWRELYGDKYSFKLFTQTFYCSYDSVSYSSALLFSISFQTHTQLPVAFIDRVCCF